MTDQTPAIRRNGLLQSCEPCRKSKLKCDHGRPICGRCTAKNITQRCFYHPAPMTRQDVGAKSQAQPQGQRQVKRPRTESSISSSPPSTIPLPVQVQHQHQHLRPDQPSITPGYLGSTSFSAVFSEHRTDLAFEEDSSLSASALAKSNDRLRLESGLEVLKFLYRSPICDTLIRTFYSGHLLAVVSYALMEPVLDSLKRTFEELKRESNSNDDLEGKLRDLVLRISRNSAHPLTSHAAMTVKEYCASFTDGNLRWEVIGLVLATAGTASMSTSDSEPEFVRAAPDAHARDMLRAQIVEGSNICLGFCDSSASVNELLGFFQYNDMLLKTQYYGDTSYVAWRRLGDLTATVYAAGLHQESTRAQDCPPFLQQWRKICFTAAFYADKCLSTFVGRPPYINYRYCSITPPLDIADHDFLAGGAQLEAAMKGLNADGWNSNGSVLRVSMMRLRFLLSVQREQALEIALGTFNEVDILAKYNKVIETAQKTWSSSPSPLRFDRIPNPSADYPSISFAKRHIYLDYLYTLFLVQRMIVKRTGTGQEALFHTSRKVLAIILEISGERHAGGGGGVDISRHHSWVVLYYGLPTASLLTFELLRQTQEPPPHPSLPPRPELIRNLSVFVSCLSWVAAPGQGNYRVCKAVEKKLSDLLDQILDPRAVVQQLSLSQSQSSQQQQQEQGDGGGGGGGGDGGLGEQQGEQGQGQGQGQGHIQGRDYLWDEFGNGMGMGMYSLMNWDGLGMGMGLDSWEFESFENAPGKDGFPF